MAIDSDDFRSRRSTRRPCSARYSRSATKIHKCRLGWDTRLQGPNDLADKKEMQRAEVHRERGPLPRSIQSGGAVDPVAPMHIQGRESLHAAAHFRECEIFEVALLERLE